jgi:integrase
LLTTTAEVEGIIARANRQCAALYALLASSGLRVGEALALRVSDFQDGTLSISRSVWNGRETTPKTKFAIREVDLSTEVAQMLKAFIGNRKDGFLFQSREGNALGQRNALRDSLHPILERMNLEKGGFHGFRRFRVTWLRKQKTQEDLLRYWIGHGDKTVTDRYAKQNFVDPVPRHPRPRTCTLCTHE